MTLDNLEAQIQSNRDSAEREQNSTAARIREIDNDPTLSDEGKRRESEQFRAYAKTKLKEYRAKEEGLINNKITELERQLDAITGNSSSDIIAFRDAQDRAENLEDADAAEKVIARALRTNDRTLAHAVFRRALAARWNNVTQIFERENPEAKVVASDLAKLLHARDEDSFERTLIYSAFRS